jgi:predicted lipid-binding transport protein (Tim44 family)
MFSHGRSFTMLFVVLIGLSLMGGLGAGVAALILVGVIGGGSKTRSRPLTAKERRELEKRIAQRKAKRAASAVPA